MNAGSPLCQWHGPPEAEITGTYKPPKVEAETELESSPRLIHYLVTDLSLQPLVVLLDLTFL